MSEVPFVNLTSTLSCLAPAPLGRELNLAFPIAPPAFTELLTAIDQAENGSHELRDAVHPEVGPL